MSRRPNRTGGPARQARARRLDLEPLEGRTLLSSATVTAVADSGAGSLRAAITYADAHGPTSISFAIPGSGVQTITLQSPLPAITVPVGLDGTTQGSGPNGAPLVVIDGSGLTGGANGLTLSPGASDSTIRGLAIVGFSSGGGGNGIVLNDTGGGNTITDDYIGVEADGSTAKGNGSGILVFSPNNTIGGTNVLGPDVISGNAYAGVQIATSSATGNVVSGDLIGTNAADTAGVGNLYGVVLSAPNNTIGGTSAAAANVISGNVGPQANTGIGILFQGQASGNLVEGNKIGTNAAGTSAIIPGGFQTAPTYSNTYGIYLGSPSGSTADNVVRETIGGTAAGAANVISGNFIGITGITTSSLIEGNTIGLNGAGTAPISNGSGILLTGGSLTTIGGATPAARNIISGSSTVVGAGAADGAGLNLSGDSDVVEGNFIGTAANGLAATGTGNAVGVELAATNSTLGGSTFGASNIISGNSGDGVDLSGGGGDVLFGNVIGLDYQGNPDGNGASGVVVEAPGGTATPPFALSDSIGGTVLGQGNTIARNADFGVYVVAGASGSYTGVGIRGNRIFSNSLLGISTSTQSPTTPTPSTLFINGVSTANGMVTVSGVYFDAPGTTIAVDLFANGASTSGYGQGPVYLGPASATTNASGFAVFSLTTPAPSTPYTSFSATYTGSSGNTSEFTANHPTVASASVADLQVKITSSSPSVTVGNGLILDETITNLGPGTASNVMFHDTLPTSLINATIATSQGTGSVGAGNVFSALIGSLAPGASASVVIAGVTSLTGVVVDQPGVSSTVFDPNYANNLTTQSIAVEPASTGTPVDLAVVVSTSPVSAVGNYLTYTVTVGNIGPGTSTNATVNDFLPTSATFDAITASQQASAPTLVGNHLSLNLGTIAPLGLATITIVVTPTAAGSITNAANVSGNQYDPVTSNNASSVTTTVAASINLSVTQASYPSTGAVGQFLAFNITATNSGPDAATNATLVDQLPSNVAFYRATPSQGGSPTLVNGKLTVDFGTIAAGATATLSLIVVPTAVGAATNVAAIYTPDVPTFTPYVNSLTVPIVAGPSVLAVNGSGSNAQIVITFNEALNPTTATNPANYQLVALGTSGKSAATTIKVASITYNPLNNTVAFLPAQAIDPTQYYRLTLIGSTASGIADSLGRKLAGTLYGAAGGDFATTFFAGTLPQA